MRYRPVLQGQSHFREQGRDESDGYTVIMQRSPPVTTASDLQENSLLRVFQSIGIIGADWLAIVIGLLAMVKLKKGLKVVGCLCLALVVYGIALNRFGLDFEASAATIPIILSHRGVHQTFDGAGLDNPTGCSAIRIHEPQHQFLENTIPSIGAAFELGADIVEVDIRGTKDNQIVVFHDSILDCRTDGRGYVRDRNLEYIQSLDVGYGYTADAGKTYPFRGRGMGQESRCRVAQGCARAAIGQETRCRVAQGCARAAVGQIKTLMEVIEAFPDQQILIDYKDGGNQTAMNLGALLSKLPAQRQELITLYALPKVFQTVQQRAPGIRRFNHKSELKKCMAHYMLYGWLGLFPESCANRTLGLPVKFAWLLWGYPKVFLRRLHDHGSVFYLAGVDTEETYLAAVSAGVDGVITERIEIIGPIAKQTGEVESF